MQIRPDLFHRISQETRRCLHLVRKLGTAVSLVEMACSSYPPIATGSGGKFGPALLWLPMKAAAEQKQKSAALRTAGRHYNCSIAIGSIAPGRSSSLQRRTRYTACPAYTIYWGWTSVRISRNLL